MVLGQKSKISVTIWDPQKYFYPKNICLIGISIVKVMGIASSTYKFQTLCQNDKPLFSGANRVLFRLGQVRLG